MKSAESDYKLNKGKEKLNRDLDIVKMLEMIKDYRVMKQVIFTQDDRFFLQLQHRDMICSSTSEQEDDVFSMKRSEFKGSKSINEELFLDEDDDSKGQLNMRTSEIFDQTGEFTEDQKFFVRQLLKKYEDRKVSEYEFRILQGVLTTNFGNLENEWREAKLRHKRA